VSKTLGPFCGIGCAFATLKGTSTSWKPDSLRTLMTEPPAGRDR
jgi:hypothetical protein